VHDALLDERAASAGPSSTILPQASGPKNPMVSFLEQ